MRPNRHSKLMALSARNRRTAYFLTVGALALSIAVSAPVAPAQTTRTQKAKPVRSHFTTSLIRTGSGFEIRSRLEPAVTINLIALQNKTDLRRRDINFPSKTASVSWTSGTLKIAVKREKLYTTDFHEIPTSPRLRSRADIRDTIQNHENRGASVLSGYQVFDQTAYLLVRWEEADGTPWLEALVKLKLDDADPRPQVLTVLPGLSFASTAVPNVLGRNGSTLVALLRKPNEPDQPWGRWDFHLDDSTQNFAQLGSHPKFAKVEANGSASFIDQTSDGGYRSGIIYPNGTTQRLVFESDYPISVPLLSRGKVLETTDDKGRNFLVSLATGSVSYLNPGTSVIATQAGILLVSKLENPDQAMLLDPDTLAVLAKWEPKTPE